MKKIVLTGGSGFIGSNLVPYLAKQGYELHLLQRNSTATPLPDGVYSHIIPKESSAFTSLLKQIAPDGIIHLATCFLASHKTEQIPDMISANVTLGCLLLQAVSELPLTWFLNIGTFWQHINASSYHPVNLYAATKQAFEVIARYYYQEFPINFLTLCLNDTYGPGDKRRKIFNLWKELLTSDTSLDMTEGEQIMDILYITDCIAAIGQCITLLEQDKIRQWNGKIVYASSSHKQSLRETAQIFERVSGRKLRINWGKKQYRPNEIMKPACFGIPVPKWKSKISLEEGIRKFLENE